MVLSDVFTPEFSQFLYKLSPFVMTSTPESGHMNEGFNDTSRTSSSDLPSGSSSPVYYYDNVTVSLVPEKKGLFLKHSEYEV